MTSTGISPALAVREISVNSPQRTALVYEDRRISYAELVDKTRRTVSLLTAGGVAEGDRVAYVGLNSPAFLTTWLACAWLGAVFVPVNSRLTAEEVRQVADDSGAHTLLVEPGHRALVEEAAANLPVRLLLEDEDPADPAPALLDPRWTRTGSAAADPAVPEPLPRHEDHLAMLAYTSGTTGRAKGVMLTHGNLWWNAANLNLVAPVRPDDVNLVVAPLFHTAPLGCFTLRQLAVGGVSVIRRTFDAGEALADLVEHRVDTFFAVPAIYTALSRLAGFAEADLGRLRSAVVAGAPAPERLIAEYAAHGVRLRQAYGLTETLFVTMLPEDEVDTRPGSVGPALPHTGLRLLDPGTGEELAEPGARGEVCVRGPHVSPGYWNAGAPTRDAGGWFRTGDIGQLDAEGRLHIVDRLKDMVIVGGDNVYPAELEQVLMGFPGVLEVAAVGAPNEVSGERMVALLACRPGVSPRLPEIRAFARPHLAGYKLPTKVIVVDALPRNVMGKVDKNAIRHALAS